MESKPSSFARHFDLIKKRSNGLMKHLDSDSALLQEYDPIIKDQLNKGIVEPVGDSDQQEVGHIHHYLPHQLVIRKDKKTTEVQVVYDASARSVEQSLNNCLNSGPPLLQEVFDVLLRFRVPCVALTSDIEKAFLIISILPEDFNVLQFLWWDDPTSDVQKLISLQFT